MDFAYSFLLKLLYPTSVCLILPFGAAVFQKRAPGPGLELDRRDGGFALGDFP
jgi:hypothetical protein